MKVKNGRDEEGNHSGRIKCHKAYKVRILEERRKVEREVGGVDE